MYTTNKEANSEARDAQLVDLAAKAIYVDNLAKAQSLLQKVILNTPSNYLYSYEEGSKLVVKFWNQQEFNQYYSWQKKQGIDKTIFWVKSAYPRAYYFLGFLKIKTKEYQQAIYFLDEGLALEPTNPKFLFEKAKALIGLELYEEALAIYSHINTVGAYISKYDIAKALQERGTLLLNRGDLDKAEETYRQSLSWDNHNEIALYKLKEIEQLREDHLPFPSKGLTPQSYQFTENKLYQSFMERSYLNQANTLLKDPEFAKSEKMKSLVYFMAIVVVFLLGFGVIISAL